MKNAIQRLVNSKHGVYVFSIILGLGLASLFRKACSSRNCLVFKAPSLDTIKNSVYRFNNKCYKFTENAVTCKKNNSDTKVVEFE